MADATAVIEIHSPRPDRRLTAGAIGVLGGLAAIGMLSTNIMLPAFPTMAESLHVSGKELGILLSSFFTVFAIGQIVVGPLSDRFGRRRIVIGGILVFLAGTALCFFAHTLPGLVVGRMVQALGVTGLGLSSAIARDLFEGEDLTRALALTMIAIAAAPGFSPLLGGVIVTFFGWRTIFLVVGASAAVVGASFLLSMGETHPADRRIRISVKDAVRAYGRLAIDFRFLLPAVSVGVIFGGLSVYFATAPAMLIGEFELTPIQYGLFSASTVFIVFGAALLAPRLAHRFGLPAAARLGAAFAALGGISLLLSSTDFGLAGYTASVALFLFGMGVVTPLGTAMALTPFKAQAGLAASLLGFCQMGSAALATALTTTLNAAPVTTMGALQILGALLASLLLMLYAQRAEVAAGRSVR